MTCGPCCLVSLVLRQYYNPFCCLFAPRAHDTFTLYLARRMKPKKVRNTHSKSSCHTFSLIHTNIWLEGSRGLSQPLLIQDTGYNNTTFLFGWQPKKDLKSFPTSSNTVTHRLLLLPPFTLRSVAGLLRLKGAYDPTTDLEEMKREKEQADKEPRVSILSLVRLTQGEICCLSYLVNFP